MAAAHGLPLHKPATLKSAEAPGRHPRGRSRRHGGRRLWPHPSAGRARHSQARVPEHPRLAAAALAGRGADPARAPRRRRGDRRRHHAHGGGARYRSGAAGKTHRRSARAILPGHSPSAWPASAPRPLWKRLLTCKSLVPQRQDERLCHLCGEDHESRGAASTGAFRPPRSTGSVRAFNPAPGAETVLDGQTLKIWEALPVRRLWRPGSGDPGEPGRLTDRVRHGGPGSRVPCSGPGARRPGSGATFFAETPSEPGAMPGPLKVWQVVDGSGKLTTLLAILERPDEHRDGILDRFSGLDPGSPLASRLRMALVAFALAFLFPLAAFAEGIAVTKATIEPARTAGSSTRTSTCSSASASRRR